MKDHGFGKKKTDDFDTSHKPFCACTVNAVFRMKLFEEIGLMDPRYFQTYTCSDIGWRARIMVKNFECKFIPDAISYLEESHTGSRFETRLNFIKRRERNCVINLLKYAPERELNNALFLFQSRKRSDGALLSLRKQIVDEVLENRTEWITGIFNDLREKKTQKIKEVWNNWCT